MLRIGTTEAEATTSHVGTGALARSVEQGSTNAYALSEFMVGAAAREIKDGDRG